MVIDRLTPEENMLKDQKQEKVIDLLEKALNKISLLDDDDVVTKSDVNYMLNSVAGLLIAAKLTLDNKCDNDIKTSNRAEPLMEYNKFMEDKIVAQNLMNIYLKISEEINIAINIVDSMRNKDKKEMYMSRISNIAKTICNEGIISIANEYPHLDPDRPRSP
ncbi:MAG: hypothetical protein LBS40_04495 [Burkholderiales bacterium]|jgi:hypothetical protein|nr:hypothetical protein [Burkholderiales bacterium]